MKSKYLLMATILLSCKSFALSPIVTVDVEPRYSSCIKNNPCLVASSHFASVFNPNPYPITVYVRYEICPQNEDCAHDTYQIIVSPGTWHDNKWMTTGAKYHYYGDFNLRAITTLYDEKHKTLGTITKNGKIQVHD